MTPQSLQTQHMIPLAAPAGVAAAARNYHGESLDRLQAGRICIALMVGRERPLAAPMSPDVDDLLSGLGGTRGWSQITTGLLGKAYFSAVFAYSAHRRRESHYLRQSDRSSCHRKATTIEEADPSASAANGISSVVTFNGMC